MNKDVEQSPAAERSDAAEKLFSCMCSGNCQSRCRLLVHVRDGRAVKTSMAPFPDERYNRVCLRGLSHVQRIYDPNRLKYPLKRVGARGEGKFERISWDEAIDTIVTRFKHYQQVYGRQSVAFSAVSGSEAYLNGAYSSFRLANAMHATQTEHSLDMSDTHGLGRVLGTGNTWNQSNDRADLVNAKTILIWAANITDSHPHDWRFVVEAQQKGARIVVIDPRFTTCAAKADQWISIRPGSDPALALSMAEVIISEKLYDEAYLLKHTVAPFLVREDTQRFLRQSDLTGIVPEKKSPDPYMVWDSAANEARILDLVEKPALEGAFDVSGIKVTTAFSLLKKTMAAYTPDHGGRLCDVAPDTIRNLARLYATNKPASIYNGFIQYDNGVQTGHAWGILAALTANIGKPGASVGHIGRVGHDINFAKLFFPEGRPNSKLIPWVYLKEVLKSGEFRGQPHPIKALYIYASNLVCNATNQNEIVNTIFPAMDFIVVADMVETDTTRYADIVLPVCHWFEMIDIVQGPFHPYTAISEQALEPAYESKSNMDIYRMIAKGLGLGEHFDYTDEEFIQMLLDNDTARAEGLAWERLKEEKVIQTLPTCWVNWQDNKFPTRSGRMEFYLEDPKPRLNCGVAIDQSREHLPVFAPPIEAWPDNPLYKKYPLVYHTVRQRWRLHSQWFGTPWLRELDPEPFASINSKDARQRGIEEGDIVEVFNDRGHVVLKAKLSEAQRPGMITVPKGWQRDQFIAGSYQELTHDYVNTTSYNQCFYDVLCEVRRYSDAKAG